MKNAFALSIAAAATVIPAAASAQNIVLPPDLGLYQTNLIANPGFESSLSGNWDRTGGYTVSLYDGHTTYTEHGFSNSKIHRSGNRAFDFGIDNQSWSVGLYSPVRQALSTPSLGSSIVTASVWVYSPGQYLTVKVLYTDNTTTSAKAFFNTMPYPLQTPAWKKWDFKGAILPNKTVKAIEFSAYSDKYYPYDIAIDDVTIGKVFKIQI